MDFKFARLQYPKDLDWNLIKCRVNKYHVKSIFIILSLGSCAFFLVENLHQGIYNNNLHMYIVYVL